MTRNQRRTRWSGKMYEPVASESNKPHVPPHSHPLPAGPQVITTSCSQLSAFLFLLLLVVVEIKELFDALKHC